MHMWHKEFFWRGLELLICPGKDFIKSGTSQRNFMSRDRVEVSHGVPLSELSEVVVETIEVLQEMGGSSTGVQKYSF